MKIKNALLHDLPFAVVLLITLCCYLINSSHLYFLSSQLDFKLFEDRNYVLFYSLPRYQNSALQQMFCQVLLYRLRSRNKTYH